MFTQITLQHHRCGGRWTAASVARLRATLRAALNAAVRQRLVSANAARDVELPPVPRPRPVLWTDARVAAWQATGTQACGRRLDGPADSSLLRCRAGDPLYPLYHLIACRGLRRGEAAGLTWPDIDLDAAALTVSQQLLDEDGKLLFGPPKSQTSRRTMPLDHRTVSVLRRHREAQRSRSQDGALWPWAGLMFTRGDGRPLRPEYITRHFQRLAAMTGSRRSACTACVMAQPRLPLRQARTSRSQKITRVLGVQCG